ncbi:acyclic terpene utilization AtuA family protein [Aquisediminimonas profunda]|uniref:acyclic terpene utilization AtuA family protein n=1 Tax=Aquisediminimonas profunda TaxID=1550733 RepID=UPI001C62F680|nr:acyclic terpene utilization AtuA family protein [Aquisediminimonas profunda]
MTRKAIKIGGASGFWGDSGIALPQLLRAPELDYVVFDYLAEITMSIMARARSKNAIAGYATDFVSTLVRHLPAIAERKIKIISNAGGVNPESCAQAIRGAIESQGLQLKVAVVHGDDIMPQLEDLRSEGTCDMFTSEPLPENIQSANVYLGAFPIAFALDRGADIVITGRCVDSAVTLGACIHEFGWTERNLNELAGGSLAGHILECGAQASGGIHTDWELTGDWSNIGYPIASIYPDGSFDVEKAPDTGGLVSFGTVAEQLLYEIGDPAAYILPDVVCDFTQVQIEEIGPNCVHVGHALGKAPTECYKASITYSDGFRVGMYLTVIGIDAARKARKLGESVLKRCERLLRDDGKNGYSETSLEIIGSEAAYGPHSRATHAREVIMKLAAKHHDAAALELLVKEATSSGTSMAPGITNLGGNRPRVMPLVRLFSCLVPKSKVRQAVDFEGTETCVPISLALDKSAVAPIRCKPVEAASIDAATHIVPLVQLAWARSGDKGNSVNIGVIARKPEYLPYIKAALTETAVSDYFAYNTKGTVRRFDVPGINALNFLLNEALDGGGIASLRNDPQGKGHAQILLDYPIRVPEKFL